MNTNTFEDFLKEEHAKTYQGIDDNMPDSFEAWLETRQLEDIIKYGNLAVREAEIRGIQRGTDIAVKTLQGI